MTNIYKQIGKILLLLFFTGLVACSDSVRKVDNQPPSSKPTPCGAEKQRACEVWERVPSCNEGLSENTVGYCTKKYTSDNSCGGYLKRACKVWERGPSCNKGLVEKLSTGRCVTKSKKKNHPLWWNQSTCL